MIRVLHVVSSLGTGSGVMSVLMNYHRVIDKEKIQFDYITYKKVESSYEEEIKKLGGRVYYCSKPGFCKGFAKEIKAFFEDHKSEYSILHCHPVFSAFAWGRYAKRSGFRHIIQHSHTTEFGNRRLAKVRNFLLLTLSRSVITDCMACSEKAKELFYWKRPEEVFFLPNAIDCGRYIFGEDKSAVLRKELGIGENEMVIGHVGRFQIEKNHAFIMEIFREVLKRVPDAKLVLAGDGVLREEIEALAKKKGIRKSCLFLGIRKDVPELMRMMNAFLLPSHFEGLGLVCIEAQATGLPCVVSDRVPMQTVITTGLVDSLSLEASAGEWAEAVIRAAGKGKVVQIEMIRKQGYDIRVTVKKLEGYYTRWKGSDRS